MIKHLGGQVQPVSTITNSVRRETNGMNTTESFQSQQQQNTIRETVSKDKLEKIVDSMNDFVSASNTHLKFEFHDKLNEYYVTVIDDITQEVVKEIPSKKMLDMYAAMTEFLGVMVDRKI
ncbi:flagellar protein FlaG [Heyndrickxia sp. NPDC080065]|uniref:flagellar protein FlaG n=1 Tax=Heyndrickxia sp. NPDC080065 TaxID=3390568 RepID=UPI003D07AA24